MSVQSFTDVRRFDRRTVGNVWKATPRTVNKVLPFASPARETKRVIGGGQHRLHAGSDFLERPDAHSHAVQFYESEEFLFDTVGQFLGAGMLVGERLLVIAHPDHTKGFLGRLDGDAVAAALASGQLLCLDARATLEQFMVGDMPDPERFHAVLGRVLVQLAGDAKTAPRIRAYGEMVDLLWRDGNFNAAIRLEELWNDAGKQHSFELLCAYLMGHFYKEDQSEAFERVCLNHSHVIPAESYAQLPDSHSRHREIALLQQRARSLENEIEQRRALEQTLLQTLERERDARARAEASDAFKEIFLGILGHDLRNPLNTVLTTARLMVMRGELAADSTKRLERIVSSSERMARMIEQILDVTRARHTTGILIQRTAAQDLVPLVAKIVDEVQAAHPDQTFLVDAKAPCPASVDGDRLEQVVCNLLSNAAAHGDATRPIRVEIMHRHDGVRIAVCNEGRAIEPEFLPSLFDPFERERPAGRSQGLGLGLYISERIVAAHGGTIDVTSSAEAGTRFEVRLPAEPG